MNLIILISILKKKMEINDGFISISTFTCDGTKANKCAEAKYVGKSYLCPHYNIAVLYPHLLEEYDPALNGGLPLSSFLPRSSREITWTCKKHTGVCNCHIWTVCPVDRTRRNTGCPCCSTPPLRVCPHGTNNLANTHPHLIEEWHPDNPGTPYDYTYGSMTEVKWVCKKCPGGFIDCHTWIISITGRTNSNSGCPYCSESGGMYATKCPHAENLLTKFPELCKQWSDENPFPPENYHPYSTYEALWICDQCPGGDKKCHTWLARIDQRTYINKKSGHGTDCPFCSTGGTLAKKCPHAENLLTKFPELCKQWSPDNVFPPEHYHPHSTFEAIWVCDACPSGDKKCHTWTVRISGRTCSDNTSGRVTSCPFCSGYRPCEHTSLAGRFPELISKEWVFEKNDIDPKYVSYGTNDKYYWRCLEPTCGIIYPQRVNSKTCHNKGCPECKISKGEKLISKILTRFNVSFEREFKIYELGSKRFDFKFSVPVCNVITEYDGEQHFKFCNFFNKTKEGLIQRRRHDVLKHLVILSSKYRYKIIRIDYTICTEETIQSHLLTGFASPSPSYYSTPALYDWMIAAETEFWSRCSGLPWDRELALCHEIASKISEQIVE